MTTNIQEAQVLDEGESLLLPDEVAAMLQVPVTWVYAAAREERIPCVRAGRYVRFRKADVLTYIASGGQS